MSTLHLLRHAEARWASLGPDGDLSRPLSGRGVQQARGVGVELRRVGGVDLIIASSATRTLQTAEALDLRVPLWVRDEVYNGSPDSILRQLRAVPDGFRGVVVVGHAPGIPALAHALADASSDRGARSTVAHRYPPATLTTLQVHGTWSQLRTATLTGARLAPELG